MLRSLDMWRCAIVTQQAAALSQADLVADRLVWFPPDDKGFTFRADPFGLWRDGQLHVFVERFDYRELRGCIELLVYDERLRLVESEVILRRPWHLSYPFLVEADGAVWMLPEARRSGELTLYRAAEFPRGWEAAATIPGIGEAVDASLLFHGGQWWLFYAIARHGREPQSALHLAFAERLQGPWRQHPLHPVRSGMRATRPAGTPLLRADRRIDLPVQDGSRTYGGAVRRLTIAELSETRFEAEETPWLEPAPALAPFVDGLHTLSAAGNVTLIDCKRIDRSIAGTLIWQRGRISRRLGKASLRSERQLRQERE